MSAAATALAGFAAWQLLLTVALASRSWGGGRSIS
jgi:hypothetical protein